jgi:hypothetical protein
MTRHELELKQKNLNFILMIFFGKYEQFQVNWWYFHPHTLPRKYFLRDSKILLIYFCHFHQNFLILKNVNYSFRR